MESSTPVSSSPPQPFLGNFCTLANQGNFPSSSSEIQLVPAIMTDNNQFHLNTIYTQENSIPNKGKNSF